MSKKKMEKVECHHAYFFICPKCGKRVYGPLCKTRPTEEEKQDIALSGGNDEEYDFVLLPTIVECKKCNIEYVADYPNLRIDQ